MTERTARGGAVEVRSLREALDRGPVFLVFAKRHCPTCQYSLPFVDRIARSYPRSPVSVFLIAQENEKEARRMVDDLDLQMAVLLDGPPCSVSEKYELTLVPTAFFVNSEGLIENVLEGFQREALKAVNEQIALAGSSSPTPLFTSSDGVPPFRPG
ncbi:MAG: peroxiredoxin family protein [Acidobacteriota bacterium]